MDSKLLLFDIDGTLLKTGSAGDISIRTVVSEIFKQEINLSDIAFAGRTDRLIIADIVNKYQKSQNELELNEAIDLILTKYLRTFKQQLSINNTIKLLAGVETLLEKLNEIDTFHLGIVTGNVRLGAKLKLNGAGIADYFTQGAFGDDFRNRNLLPPLAVRRSAQQYEVTYQPQNIWVIGDTIYDIQCGKVNNYKTLAVETGGNTREELEKNKPDFILKSLENTEDVISIFLNH